MILPINSIDNKSAWSKQVDVYNYAAVFPVVITHLNASSLRICPVDVFSSNVSGQSVHLQYLYKHQSIATARLPLRHQRSVLFTRHLRLSPQPTTIITV